ncbi:MAG: hypothetical protein CMC56_00520 [Flavobacteriaceae bacterium]|jgi:hypothetical protein|nr:hypothetical protein [Flavobacteriaceae bacterium]|tara:strand:+ start:142 stop:414 length:273 start_codon:yes stop_codon:yes gene_type:complete
MKLNQLKKTQKLLLSLFFDALGYLSFLFPLSDFVWAPLSAYLMANMYKGKKGKIAAVVVFVEEALPFLDVIPSFTIMWFYTHLAAPDTKN